MKKILCYFLLFFTIITLIGCNNKLEIIGDDKVIVNESIILSHNFNKNSDATWLSSNEEIAIVDNGFVVGVSQGEVVITLCIGNKEATKVINVIYPVINITLNTQSTIKLGDTYTIEAKVPSQFEGIDEGKWSSSNEDVAIVGPDGTVLAKNIGETTISFEYFGNIAQTNIKVIYKDVMSLALQGENTVSARQTLQLNTIFYPTNSFSDCVYTSSNNEIATVDENGLVTGISVGTVVITVSLKNDPSINASMEITVLKSAPKSIDVVINEDLKVGEYIKFNIFIDGFLYTDFETKEISLSCSNNSILNGFNNYLLGLNEGSCTLKVSSTLDENIYKEVEVTVLKNDNIKFKYTEEQLKRVDDILSKMTLNQKVGQMFVIGFNGTSFSSSLENAIKQYNFGNVIYMGANVTNTNTLQKMSQDIQNCMKQNNTVPAIISIDQEGGRVARIKNGGTHFISNMAIASTNNFHSAYLQGEAMGKELLYYGINMDWAPVLDVNNNHNNPVIGVRSYSDSPFLTSIYGQNLIKGLQDNGVIACPKHFPGHGNTNVDSHVGLPIINSDLNSLYSTEFVPFINAINNGMDCIMTTHIIFNAIDNEYPATLSNKVLTGLLRGEWGYEGLIVTDGMEMNAVAKNYGDYDKTAVLAIKAGVDMLLYTSTNNPIKAHNGVIKAINNGEITEDRINESVRRILLTKFKYGILDLDYDIINDINSLLENNEKLNNSLAQQAVTIAKGEFKGFDKTKKTLIISPTTSLDLGIKLNDNSFANYASEYLKSQGFSNCDYMIISTSVNSSQANSIINKLKDYEQIVFASTNNLSTNYNAIKIVDEINKLNVNSLVIALDSPYDYLNYNGENINTYVCVFGYQKATVIALSKFLNNEFEVTSKLSIDSDLFK